MRKGVLLLLVVCMALLFCSCRHELSDDLIVEAVAIDRTKDGLQLTVQTLDAGTGEEGGEGEKSRLYTVTGSTADEALSQLTVQTGKQPVYSHNRLLLFSDELAADAYTPDFFIRSIQLRAHVLVAAAEGSAADVLLAGGDSLSARQMEESLLEGEKTAQTIAPRLYEYLNEKADPMTAERLPVFSVMEDDEKKQAVPNGILLVGSEGQTVLLDQRESELLSMLSGSEQGLLSGDADGAFSLRCTENEAKSRMTLADGGSRVEMTLRLACDLTEYDGEADEAALDAIAKAAETDLTARITAFYEKTTRQNGLDALGLYPNFLKKETGYCKTNLDDGETGAANWRKLLENAEVSVTVEVRIRRAGQSVS